MGTKEPFSKNETKITNKHQYAIMNIGNRWRRGGGCVRALGNATPFRAAASAAARSTASITRTVAAVAAAGRVVRRSRGNGAAAASVWQ